MERKPIKSFIRTPISNLHFIQPSQYPAIVIVGKLITREQAAEIIIRTDKLISWEVETGLRINEYKQLSLKYLYNEWITSDYVLGPHGWCDWDGNIGCSHGNIGPYPTVEWIEYEWKLLLYYFPFLELQCQLFDREVSDVGRKPLIQFNVGKGKVETILPVKCLPHTVYGAKYRSVREWCSAYPVNDRYKGYKDMNQLQEAYGLCPRLKK